MKVFVFILFISLTSNLVRSQEDVYYEGEAIVMHYDGVYCSILFERTLKSFLIKTNELKEGFRYEFILKKLEKKKGRRENARVLYWNESERQKTLDKRKILKELKTRPKQL